MANRRVESGSSSIFGGALKSLQMVTKVMELRCLFLGRKAMTNLDSIFKSRDITKCPYSQSYGFAVVMYRCENWTIKKGER